MELHQAVVKIFLNKKIFSKINDRKTFFLMILRGKKAEKCGELLDIKKKMPLAGHSFHFKLWIPFDLDDFLTY